MVTVARSPGGHPIYLFAGLFRAVAPPLSGALVCPVRGEVSGVAELPEISESDLRELTAGMALLGRGVTEVLARRSPEENAPEDVVRRYVDGSFRDDISLEHVAAMLGWSSSYAATQIRKIFGKTLSELINERRVENAKWLLRNKYMPAVVIGRCSGFRSPAQFHRVFRRLAGMTPMEFKKSGK